MDHVERKVCYFNYCGEINTDTLLETAQQYCTDNDIHTVVVASETGRSAVKPLETLKKTNVKIVVVTHYPATTWGSKGNIPIGLKRKEYADNLKKLLDNRVKIVQGTRPFAPPTRSLNWETTAEGIVNKTLELFGAGTKIAIEAAVMATDA